MTLGFNDTEFIGATIKAFTSNVTGSLLITGLVLLVLTLLIFAAFRLPLELVLMFGLPLVIVMFSLAILPPVVAGIVIIILGFLMSWMVWSWLTNQ